MYPTNVRDVMAFQVIYEKYINIIMNILLLLKIIRHVVIIHEI